MTVENIAETFIISIISVTGGFFLGMATGSKIEPLTVEQEYNELYSDCIKASYVNRIDLGRCNEIRMPSTIKEKRIIQ